MVVLMEGRRHANVSFLGTRVSLVAGVAPGRGLLACLASVLQALAHPKRVPWKPRGLLASGLISSDAL